MPKINGKWYDEEELQRELISLCGGISKADQLQIIWRNSYPSPSYGLKTKEDSFRLYAKREGYSDKAIELFILC